MRKLALFFVLLLFAGRVEAGPLDWMKHHKRFLLMESAAIGAASIHAYGLHKCRHNNGVEVCSEGYGSAWAFFGVATGVNTIVLPAVAKSCWKDGHGKFCNILAYGGSATQMGYGIYQGRIHEKTERSEHFNTVTFDSVKH